MSEYATSALEYAPVDPFKPAVTDPIGNEVSLKLGDNTLDVIAFADLGLDGAGYILSGADANGDTRYLFLEPEKPIVLGRSPDHSGPFSFSSYVSSKHASVEWTTDPDTREPRLAVTDLGSTNGTFIKQTPRQAEGQRTDDTNRSFRAETAAQTLASAALAEKTSESIGERASKVQEILADPRIARALHGMYGGYVGHHVYEPRNLPSQDRLMFGNMYAAFQGARTATGENVLSKLGSYEPVVGGWQDGPYYYVGLLFKDTNDFRAGGEGSRTEYTIATRDPELSKFLAQTMCADPEMMIALLMADYPEAATHNGEPLLSGIAKEFWPMFNLDSVIFKRHR